jgi:hypothetical protein
VKHDAPFRAHYLAPESDEEQTSAQFSGVSTRSILQDKGLTPVRERKEIVTRTSKESLHSNTQYYDSDDETTKPKAKGAKSSRKRSAPSRPLPKPLPVAVDDASSSSSGEEVEEEVLPKPKRTRSAPATVALNKMVQAANDTMTRLAQFQHPPSPFQQASSAPAGNKSGAKSKQICFACANEIEDWRTHKNDCLKGKQKILTCPHCKISLKAGSQLSMLFGHMMSCAMKNCSTCNSSDHSNHYCPKLQCTICTKFGHSRILHSLSSGGITLIASNSADKSA